MGGRAMKISHPDNTATKKKGSLLLNRFVKTSDLVCPGLIPLTLAHLHPRPPPSDLAAAGSGQRDVPAPLGAAPRHEVWPAVGSVGAEDLVCGQLPVRGRQSCGEPCWGSEQDVGGGFPQFSLFPAQNAGRHGSRLLGGVARAPKQPC